MVPFMLMKFKIICFLLALSITTTFAFPNTNVPSSTEEQKSHSTGNGTRWPGCANFCTKCFSESYGFCDENEKCCQLEHSEANQLEQMFHALEAAAAAGEDNKKEEDKVPQNETMDLASPPAGLCRQFCVHCMNTTNGLCDRADRCCVSSDTQLERDFEQVFLGEQNNETVASS